MYSNRSNFISKVALPIIYILIIIIMGDVLLAIKKEDVAYGKQINILNSRFELLEQDTDTEFTTELTSLYADKYTGVVYIKIEKLRTRYESGVVFTPLYNKDGSLLSKDDYFKQKDRK